jgi:hypothetical protein
VAVSFAQARLIKIKAGRCAPGYYGKMVFSAKGKTVKLRALHIVFVIAAISVGIGLVASSSDGCAADSISFSQDVAPILKGRCIGCHQPGGEGYETSGLDLTSYQALMKGTKFGPMVVPGDPGSSNLIWLLDWRASVQMRMPHGAKQLSTRDRDAFREWIRQGAKDN